VDEFDVLTVETNQEGYYSAIFPVSAGNHTIQSSFDDITFPLNPSFSDIFIINVTPTGTLNWSMSIGLIIILVSMVVSVWYAHRSKQTIVSISPEAPLPANFTTSEESLEKTPFQEDVLAMYQHHFERREWSKAAHLLYRSIIERIEFLSIESDLSTKTPRELLPLLSPLLSGISLQSFVKRYEEIRYGGCRLLEQDPLLLHWIQITSHIMGAGNE
jgi:hypothetical protein